MVDNTLTEEEIECLIEVAVGRVCKSPVFGCVTLIGIVGQFLALGVENTPSNRQIAKNMVVEEYGLTVK